MKRDLQKGAREAGRRVLVIGAGPAGSFAAISAAQNGARVTVLERQALPGRKLLATGGGRCNVTNTLSSDDFIEKFGPTGRFMTNALKELSSRDLLKMLESWGVFCDAEDGFHYFPRSQRAADVLSAINKKMDQLRIDVQTGVAIEDISFQDNEIIVSASGGRKFKGQALILATGGAGYPTLGGNSSGYDLARMLGHNVITPVTGLVGLRTSEAWPGQCAGITLPDVAVKIAERGFRGRSGFGDLLFTHRGISGPPVIDVSGAVSRLLLTQKSVQLSLKLCKDYQTPGALIDLLSSWRRDKGKRFVHNVMSIILPKRLASILCLQCSIPEDMIMARLPASAETSLVSLLCKTTLNVTASEGFKQAMVTAGGVALKEIAPATLSSKLMPGLYFAGEVLDLDGPCGGYNLQWAISSGWLAGKSAARG